MSSTFLNLDYAIIHSMSDISWDMQFLRQASPSNGARYNIIKPQTPDGYVRCPKQPPCN